MTVNTQPTNDADNSEDLPTDNKTQVCSVLFAEAIGDSAIKELHLQLSEIFSALGEAAGSPTSHQLFVPRANLAPDWTLEDFFAQFGNSPAPVQALLPMVKQPKNSPGQHVYEADCDYCAIEIPKELLGREEIDFKSADLSYFERDRMRCRVYRIYFTDATRGGRPFRGTLLGCPTALVSADKKKLTTS